MTSFTESTVTTQTLIQLFAEHALMRIIIEAEEVMPGENRLDFGDILYGGLHLFL